MAAAGWNSPAQSPTRRIRSPPASSSTASGCIISARRWRRRRAISACVPSPRAIRSCSITWRGRSWKTAGRSRNCTSGSCYRKRISYPAPRTPRPASRSGQSAAGPRQPPPARFRVAARCAAGGVGQSRPQDGGQPPWTSRRRRYSKRRTIYGFIDRQNLPGVFRTFDFASPDSSTPQALSDDGAAAGAVHAEPSVRAGAGARWRSAGMPTAKDATRRKSRLLHRLVYAARCRRGQKCVWVSSSWRRPPRCRGRAAQCVDAVGTLWPGVVVAE